MVVVGIVGLCGSGRRTVAEVLRREHSFTLINVAPGADDELELSTISIADDGGGATKSLTFASYAGAERYVKAHWERNHVIPILSYAGLLDCDLLKRPFFLLLHLQTPLAVRGINHDDDAVLFREPGLLKLCAEHQFCLSLLNDSSLDALRQALKRACLGEAKWTRPGWDVYFMRLARLAESRSNCVKRRVGAIISSNNRVVSTGYNGTPRNTLNCREGGCERCGHGAARGTELSACLCLHAEENAIIEAGRLRAEGATLYCTTRPCLGCAKQIVQTGIVRVVFEREYAAEHDSASLFALAGVRCEQLDLDAAYPRAIQTSARG